MNVLSTHFLTCFSSNLVHRGFDLLVTYIEDHINLVIDFRSERFLHLSNASGQHFPFIASVKLGFEIHVSL